MRKILTLIVVLCLTICVTALLPLCASAEESGTCGTNLTWVLNDEGVLTISGTGDMTSSPWISWGSNIKTVVIEDGVTSISQNAFAYCTNLTSVTIGNGVTNIEYHAFYCCDGITSVYITDLAAWCEINFHNYEENPLYRGADLYLNGEKMRNLVIPDEVTTIKKYAFCGCGSILRVTIPDSVTSIGRDAFSGCGSLARVTIPDSVTSIGYGAFSDCSSLTGITIPDSVTSIGTYAFFGCTSLTSVTIPNSVTSIGTGTFWNCTGLARITIPDSVTSIGNSTFKDCTGLTGITIGNGVKNVDSFAFEGCIGLTSVYITDLAAWCEISFYNGLAHPLRYSADLYLNEKKVTKLVIPDDVEYIEDYAFYNCKSITSVVLPLNLMGMGDYVFYGCDNITDVYYCGNEEDWNFLIIGTNNECLTNATIHFNYNPDVKISCEAKKDSVHITAENVEEGNKVFAITMVDGVANATKLDLTDGEETMEVSEGVEEVKIFVWESFTSMRPLCEAIEVEIK